jgi:gamma-glutamyltranspeptidase/glutathione hydrolase/leukotriene-C4 hydrolase
MDNLMEQKYADFVRSQIKDNDVQQDASLYNLLQRELNFDLHGTSHLSIIADGSAFMSTSSINVEFGARVKGPRTGIIFNNRMTDFTRVGIDANIPAPGKLPRSFRLPLLVLDEEENPVLAIGGSGGSRIMMAVQQTLMFHMDFGLSLKDAIDFPRVAFLPRGSNYPLIHDYLQEEVLDGLARRGHKGMHHYYPSLPYTSVVQGVSLLDCDKCKQSENGCHLPCIQAVSDFRKGGTPSGI